MSLNSYYVYFLILAFGMMQVHSYFTQHFSGVDSLKHQVTIIRKELDREKLKTQIAYYEVENARQEIATLLPDKIHSKTDSYQLRSLASAVQAQEPIKIDLSKRLLERGKDQFENHRYNEAAAEFQKLIEQYPASTSIVEAYFLLSECYFQQEKTEETIETIEAMVTLFPESELTAFALLRLAGIFLERQLVEDAKEILFTVRHNFAFNQDLVKQANDLLRRTEK